MARQFSFRFLSDDARAGGGWSDLFNRLFGEPAVRFATGTRVTPLVARTTSVETVDELPAATAFALIPAIGPFGLSGGLDFSLLDAAISAPAAEAAVPLPPAEATTAASPPEVVPPFLSTAVGEGGGGIATLFSPGQNGGRDDEPGILAAGSQGYQILYTEDLGLGLIIDLAKREIVPDGTRFIDFGGGEGDVLVLAGPLAASGLPVGLLGLETVVARSGASYELSSEDYHLAPGAILTINAMELGADESLDFDGSAETDGHFAFFGGAGGDAFRGGASGDLIFGMGGGDELTGGGGADVFAYNDAAESTGADYDSLIDFDSGADLIDLSVEVTGFDVAVESGSLSTASFDDDLAAALGGLGAGHAVFFAPDSGDLAGTIFLIVDGNGEEGYQAGEDFVFALPAASVADLSNPPDFFV